MDKFDYFYGIEAEQYSFLECQRCYFRIKDLQIYPVRQNYFTG